MDYCRSCGHPRHDHNFRHIYQPGGEPRGKYAGQPARNATLEEAEVSARRLGNVIKAGVPPGWLFTLILSEMGEAQGLTYISNCDRPAVIPMLREMAKKFETGEDSKMPKTFLDERTRSLVGIIWAFLELFEDPVAELVAVRDPRIVESFGGQAEVEQLYRQHRELFFQILAKARRTVDAVAPGLLEGKRSIDEI